MNSAIYKPRPRKFYDFTKMSDAQIELELAGVRLEIADNFSGDNVILFKGKNND